MPHVPSRVIIALVAAVTAFGATASTGPTAPGDVAVTVAVVADAAVPTLSFSVTNVGDAPILKGGLTVNTNSLVVLGPTGRVLVRHSIADAFGRTPAELIRPGETAVWERPIADFLQEAPEAGTHRLYWQFGGARSRELSVVRRTARHDDAAPPAGPRDLPEQDTPQAALKSFYRGLDGDPGWVSMTLHADRADPAQVAAHEAMVRRAVAANRFRAQLRERFGEEAAAEWHLEADAWTMAAIDRARVAFPGEYFETAEVRLESWTPRLVRGAGRHWRVAASNFSRTGGPHPELEHRTAALVRTADELFRGEHATPEEALGSLRRQLAARPSSATSPSNQQGQ